MGATNSRIEELSKNEHLNRLVSKEILTPSDPFWNSFLSFNFTAVRIVRLLESSGLRFNHKFCLARVICLIDLSCTNYFPLMLSYAK